MRRILLALGVLIIVAGASGAAYYFHLLVPAKSNVAAVTAAYKTPEEGSDIYVRFVMEAYDIIQKNYWQKATDAQLANLFQLSLDKADSTTTPAVSDRAAIAKQLDAAFTGQSGDDAKRKLAAGIVQVAVYNLAPAGRSELLTAQDQRAVQQTVQNINPNSDLYSELGVNASSSEQQIQQAYEQKKQVLEASTAPAAAKELQRAQYVDQVLANPTSKQRYDATKAEPTVFAHVLGSTLYLDVARMSPETAGDFIAALDAASSTPLSSLIVDLRGNIGGSLEQVPNMLGIFFGTNQYLFDLFHQGDFQPIRSPVDKLPELARFKEMAVLTDINTQSSAEVMTAALKRFHLAIVVGTHTRGWGTVENTYPLATQIDPTTKYAIMLVWGLTLRDDNQPIDGKGVDADVSIDGKNWQAQLPQYFRSASLISAVEKTVTQPPLQ